MYLTGTEEFAIQAEDGTYTCESPKKVLICHIPPGNPDNAHTICVGAAAVKAHERNHGDPVGACEGEGDGDEGDEGDDVGEGEDPGDGGDGDGDGDGGDEDPPSEDPPSEDPPSEDPPSEDPPVIP
jgi:hypothetical protein